MGWSRSGNALHGTARLRARGDLPFTLSRKQRRLSALVFSEGAASNFYAKSLALQFEIRESVLGNEVDQFRSSFILIEASRCLGGLRCRRRPRSRCPPSAGWSVGDGTT